MKMPKEVFVEKYMIENMLTYAQLPNWTVASPVSSQSFSKWLLGGYSVLSVLSPVSKCIWQF